MKSAFADGRFYLLIRDGVSDHEYVEAVREIISIALLSSWDVFIYSPLSKSDDSGIAAIEPYTIKKLSNGSWLLKKDLDLQRFSEFLGLGNTIIYAATQAVLSSGVLNEISENLTEVKILSDATKTHEKLKSLGIQIYIDSWYDDVATSIAVVDEKMVLPINSILTKTKGAGLDYCLLLRKLRA
jgi:uncharacterized protein (DUF1810 family)